MADAVFPWEKHLPSGKRLGRPAIVPPGAVVPFPVAQLIKGRQYLWLRVCPECGRRRIYLAQKKTCSNSCGVAMSAWRRPNMERKLRAMQRKATQVRVANMERRIAAEIEGLSPVEVWRKAYDRGYASGHASGRKGYARLRDKARGAA